MLPISAEIGIAGDETPAPERTPAPAQRKKVRTMSSFRNAAPLLPVLCLLAPLLAALPILPGPQAASSPVYLAAGPVRGLGTLRPLPPPRSAPPPPYSGNPQDFHRGYAGNSPNDPWHRDNDFKARDYQLRYGPQPEYAAPPQSRDPAHPGFDSPSALAGPDMPESLDKKTMPLIPDPARTQKKSARDLEKYRPGDADSLRRIAPD
ncbi:MAG: hypothetical protein LBB66_03250 [Desulfovibrio sp.]|jgi:hypothetical protein|nr:hypothetical protein [Desulfovibrio sp.]